jgi:hypothetical protein
MRNIKLLGTMAVLVLMAACPAFGAINIFANPQVGNTVSFTTEHMGGNNGGPFTGHLGTLSWDTFCVEADGFQEVFTANVLYKVQTTTLDKAWGTGNVVNNVAKVLYWWWGTNQLTGFDYVNWSNRTSLQLAIWHGVTNGVKPLADIDHAVNPSAYIMDAQSITWYNAAAGYVASHPNDPIYSSVRVVNPVTLGWNKGDYDTGQVQSMLYAIPEPVSILVWSLIVGAGVLGIVITRRKR